MGCANIIGEYPDRVTPVKQNLNQKNYSKAIQSVQKLTGENNQQLNQLELARTYQLAGQYVKSQQNYDAVLTQVQIDQAKAKVEVSRLLTQSSALFVNPQKVSYRLMPYEVVFLMTYQALNELAQDNLSNALVYFRKAYEEQAYIQTEQAQALAVADQRADKEKLSFNLNNYPKDFNQMLTAAAKIKSGFENALTYYLTALTYFQQGDDNNAFVAIKQALALAPENPAVRALLLNILVHRGGDLTQLQTYLKNFGLKQPPERLNNTGLVVVLYEQDWVPALQTVTVPVPIPFKGNFQLQTLSLPTYLATGLSTPPLNISDLNLTPQGEPAQTAVLMNVYDLAARNLKDRYPMIFLQSALSVIAKATMTNIVSDMDHGKAGLAGVVAGSLYGMITSNADCRSWLTLPLDEQVWQSYMPVGMHRFRFTIGTQTANINMPIQGDKINFIWVAQGGSNSPLSIRYFNF